MKKGSVSTLKRLAQMLGIGLSLIAISAVHYQTVGSNRLLHEVSQRLYYLPVIYAAYSYGIRGGIATATLSVALFLPHLSRHSHDPNVYVNQYAEMIVFYLIGIVTGLMSNAQKRAHRRYEQTAEELRRAYGQLKETVDQLVLADRLASLGQFSAALVHEVRNPLASIKGAVEALEPEIPRGHPRREFLDAINHEIVRLNKLVTEFLQFARPRRPEMLLVQTNDVVRSVVTLVKKEAARLQVKLVTRFDPTLPEVMMDGEQIKQALLNLVINGMETMKGGGQLEVATSHNGRMVNIRVEDQGPGIRAEIRDRIFNPFVTTKEGGTGLGLAIAYSLVKQHHGTIQAYDARVGGSVFEIELPLKHEQKEKQFEVAAPAAAPFLKG